MESFVAKLGWTEVLFLVAVALFLILTIARNGFENLYLFRRRFRQRIATSGRAFSVLSTPVEPYEGDGPGVYHVAGVVERNGAATEFDVEAKSANDAFRKALERCVSPSKVTKQLGTME